MKACIDETLNNDRHIDRSSRSSSKYTGVCRLPTPVGALAREATYCLH